MQDDSPLEGSDAKRHPAPGAVGPAGRWLRVAAVGALLVAVALAVRVGLKQQLEPKAALALLRSVQHQWWAIPAFALCYVTLTAAFAPVVVFHMISGAAYGFAGGLLLNLVVFNLSVSLQFLAARRVGRARAEAIVARYGLTRLVRTSSSNGLRTVLSLRLVPLPSMITCLAAVLAGVRWRDFALGSFIGALPSTVIYTYFAAALVEGAAGAERKALLQTGAAALCIVVVTFGPRLLQRVRRPAGPEEPPPTSPT
jgi:uncharacterized membrane protein YdjX (TVP38/TMEM64 family)